MKNELDTLAPDQIFALENAASEIQPDKTVEEVREELAKTPKDGIKQTRENCMIIFKQDPYLKGAVRKNMLSGMIDIVKSMGWRRTGKHVTETDMNYLFLYFEKNYDIRNEKNIYGAMDIVANDNAYHPICERLKALEWDGKERIRYALGRFLGAASDDYTYESLKLCMLGAINRVFDPGCKFELMLCLVGGQGAGKSTFFRLLAIKDEWFSDDIKKLDDENIRRKIQGKWFIEMSEMLAVCTARTMGDIKSFLSRQTDTYKIPYAKDPDNYPRQCVFGGTSNDLDFLPLDRTGNRRFIPIMVFPERAEVHILENEKESREYIMQMWAEAMTIYRSGNYRLTFSKEMSEYLVTHQQEFMPEDTDAGLIIEFLENCSEDTVCSKMLYDKALHKDFRMAKRHELRDICAIMNFCVDGWRAFENPRSFGIYGRQKGWERIESNQMEPDIPFN